MSRYVQQHGYFKVGDYIYYESNYEEGFKDFGVTIIEKIEVDDKDRAKVWGYWCTKNPKQLPQTLDEFNGIERKKELSYINITSARKLIFKENNEKGESVVKKKDIKVGDYVYSSGVFNTDKFIVGKVVEVENKGSSNKKIWCFWSSEDIESLPKTVKEFEEIKKDSRKQFVCTEEDEVGMINFTGNMTKSETKNIKVIFNGSTTMVKVNGKTGSAICHEDDKFDAAYGIAMAYSRALYGKDFEPVVEETEKEPVKTLRDYSSEEILAELNRRLA